MNAILVNIKICSLGWQRHIFATFNNVEARTASQCTFCFLPFKYRLFLLGFVASLAKPNE